MEVSHWIRRINMCFSPAASFTTGAILGCMGLYASAKALQKNDRFLPFAAIPLLFSLQQFIEGGVWLALLQNNSIMTHYLSLAYIFFAFFLWPFYIPFSFYYLEPDAVKKRLLKKLVLIGLVFGAILFLPVVFDVVPLTTQLYKASIKYTTYDSGYQTPFAIAIYAFFVSFTPFISSFKPAKYFGGLVFISLLITLYFYLYAFTSVWCYFAAFISLLIVVAVSNVKKNYRRKY